MTELWKWISHTYEWAMLMHQCVLACKYEGVSTSVQMCKCKWNANMCMDENASMSTSLSCIFPVSISAHALSVRDVQENFTMF